MTMTLRRLAKLSVTTFSLLAGAAAVAACSSAPDPATATVDQAYKCSAISGCGGGGGDGDNLCGVVGAPPCPNKNCPRGTYLAGDGNCETCGTPGYPICPGASSCTSGVNVGGTCSCPSGYVAIGNTCEACGTPGYSVCPGASTCNSGVDVGGVCYATLEQILSFTSGAAQGDRMAQDSYLNAPGFACTLGSDDVVVPPELAGMGCSMGRKYTWIVPGTHQTPTTFWACTAFTGAAGYTPLTDPYKSACLGQPSSGYTLVGNFVWSDPSDPKPNVDFEVEWHQDNMGAGGPCLPPFSPPG